MTTARDIVYGAAQLVGERAVDTPLSDFNAQAMLSLFQGLADMHANSQFFAYVNAAETFPMVAGTRSYSSTLLSAGRPVNIQTVTVTLDQITYAVSIIDLTTWDSISYLPTTGIPNVMYPEMSMPNATFNFWPTPYAAFTATLNTRRPVVGTMTLDTVLELPQGYEIMFKTNLAVAAGPLFGTEAMQSTKELAKLSLRAVKRNNYRPGLMDTGLSNNRADQYDFIYKGF